MFAELSTLLSVCSPQFQLEQYRHAVVEENVLGKVSLASRKETFARLRALYILSPDHLIFRVLLDLWYSENSGKPMLAVLSSVTRDYTLRATMDLILDSAVGVGITPDMLSNSVQTAFPGRYTRNTLASIGRNTASTWRQSGHLEGRAQKNRSRAKSSPKATSFALFLAHLHGARGTMLLHTPWVRLLDLSPEELESQISIASQQGWLEYKHAGNVMDISFHHFFSHRGV